MLRVENGEETLINIPGKKIRRVYYTKNSIYIYIYRIDEWKNIGFFENFFVSLES